MYPQTPDSSTSKQKSSKTSGSSEGTKAHRPTPFQLPTPPQTKFDLPTRSQFTFSPSPTKGTDEPDENANTSTPGTAGGQDANGLKKGYGIDFSDESEGDDVLPQPSRQESPSNGRGKAWVGVRNPGGHFEKVVLEPASKPNQQSAAPASENDSNTLRPRRPIATPRRLRKPAADSGTSGKTTSTSCQTDTHPPRQARFSKPPSPYVEDEADEEDKRPRTAVEPTISNETRSTPQTSETILPSPPKTPSPPSTTTKSTQTAAADMDTSFSRSKDADIADTGSEWESSSSSDFETSVSTLHSWNWRLIARQGNFEIRSPTPSPSPASKRTPNRARRQRSTTGSPAPPPPSPMLAASLAQMKAAATVTPAEATSGEDGEQMKKKWSPPRFAGRAGDPRTTELGLRLGRLGFAADKGKAREGWE
ncbi:hypothetical protein IWZ01DRAFT_559610 [Phyllosticta capitalensis]